MKGIGRNLIFWGYYMERFFFAIIATTIFASAIAWLVSGGGWENIWSFILQYSVMMSFVMLSNNAFNNALTNFPIGISFGSTRKASYIAMQLTQHILIVQNTIFCICIYAMIFPDGVTSLKENFCLFVFIVMLLMALSNVITVVTIRFGRVCSMVVCILCVMIGIFVAGLVINSFTSPYIVLYMEKLSNLIFPMIALLGDLILIWIGYRIIRVNDIKI